MRVAQWSTYHTETPGKVMSQWALNVMPKPAQIMKKNLNIFIKIVIGGWQVPQLTYLEIQIEPSFIRTIWRHLRIQFHFSHMWTLRFGLQSMPAMLREKMKKKKKTSVLFLHWWIMERALLISMLTIWFWSTNPPLPFLAYENPISQSGCFA